MNRRQFIEKLACLFAGIMFVLASRTFAQDIRFTVEPETLTIAAREPVRLIATLENRGNQTLSIADDVRLKYGMDRHLRFEVTGPDGNVAVGWYAEMIVDYISLGNRYDAQVLPPRGQRRLLLYPNVLDMINPNAPDRLSWQQSLRQVETFERVGLYRIRVGYYVPSDAGNLWHPDGDTLWSSPVTVNVRKPTPEEQEILTALWSSSGGAESIASGWMRPAWGNRKLLRGVIAKYPDVLMVRYAMLMLAAKSWRSGTASVRDEGLRQIRELRRRWPRFNPQEVSFHRVGILSASRRFGEAVAEATTALRKWPWLVDVDVYMMVGIGAYEPNDASRSISLIQEYRAARKQGKPFRLRPKQEGQGPE